MKLLRKDTDSLTFLIGKRERDLFFAVLLRYPVLSSTHFQNRHTDAKSKQSTDLLRDALADQQRESRKQLEEWLKTEARFKEHDLGYEFTVGGAEAEWMLQLLNDVRVGSWVQLGQPDTKTAPIELTEKAVELAWAQEVAGLFQHVFLEAVQHAE